MDKAGQLDGLINADAHDVVRHLYVFDGDLKTQDQIAAGVATRNATIANDITALGKLVETPAERSAYRSFVAANQAFLGHLNQAISISRGETIRNVEERDGSRNLYLDKVLPASQATVASLHRLTTLVDKTATREADNASAAADRGSNMIMVVLVIAVIGAIALAVVVTRGIVRRVGALADRLHSLDQHCVASLENGLAAVAAGDLTVGAEPATQPIEEPGGDEIGDASRSTNQLIDKLQSSLASYNRMRQQPAPAKSPARAQRRCEVPPRQCRPCKCPRNRPPLRFASSVRNPSASPASSPRSQGSLSRQTCWR